MGPDAETWDQDGQAWNLAADQRPAAVAGHFSPRFLDAGAGAVVDGKQLLQLRRRPRGNEKIFAADTLDRLRDVKRRYDPDGLISGNPNISLA